MAIVRGGYEGAHLVKQNGAQLGMNGKNFTTALTKELMNRAVRESVETYSRIQPVISNNSVSKLQ
jgi:hypothetical protein